MNVDQGWLQSNFSGCYGFNQIGRGGQKSVYGCTHRVDGDVVLKLFHPHANTDRALREVEAVRTVQSQRVPQVLEVGQVTSQVGEIVWVREQRVAGTDLRQALSNGPMQPAALLRLSLHMLEALEAAERVHIVHRDVKPENVIAGSDGRFWLIDFGFARHLDLDSLTASGAEHAFGTLGYSPIEQCQNRKDDIDARTDLFALGVTLYECATGRNPYRDGNPNHVEVFKRIETQPLPAIPGKIDSASQFRELVLAMTRTHRGQRLRNAAEALEWMREIATRDGIA